MRKTALIFMLPCLAMADASSALALDLSTAVSDPWDSAAMTSPGPAVPWQGTLPFSAVSAPKLQNAPSPTDKALSLIELTDIALRNNPQTRAAWAAARASAAGVGLAKAAYLPQIDGQASISENKVATTAGIAIPLQTRYGASISLTYLLLDFGARAGQLHAAKYNLLAANLAQNQTIQDVILQVEQAYYQALGFFALQNASRDNLRSAQSNLEAAQARLKAGLAPIGDVYQAETAVAQAKLALQRAEGQRAASQGQLASALGLPVDTPLHLQNWSSAPPPALDKSPETLLREARSLRPSLLAAEAKARAAQSQIAIAASQGRPSLSLTAGTGFTRIVGRADIPQYNIGLSLRIPIFTGFRTAYGVRQARAQAEQAEAQRDQTAQSVALDVWQAYFNQKTAMETLSSSNALLRSATQAADAARARYRAGLGTILETLSTQAAEASARVQAIQAQLDWYASLAALGHAVGTLISNPTVKAAS